MGDWLSYSLADFLPLSRETYQGLFALYNVRFSPAFAAGLMLGVASLGVVLRRQATGARILLAGFGLSWLWIAWAFHLQTLGPLVWAAELFALLFALQSGLLLAVALLPLQLPGPVRPSSPSWLGYAMLAMAVLLYPLAGLAANRNFPGLELFGTAPDPTAVATLAVGTLLPKRLALLLIPIPAFWCLVASLLLHGIASPLWWLPITAMTLGLVLNWWQHHGGLFLR